MGSKILPSFGFRENGFVHSEWVCTFASCELGWLPPSCGTPHLMSGIPWGKGSIMVKTQDLDGRSSSYDKHFFHHSKPVSSGAGQ